MKPRVLLFLLIALTLGAAACAAPVFLPADSAPEGSAPAESQKAAYSVFIYVCGSDLESNHGSATRNIQELLDADLGGGINIILQTGGTRKWRDFGISPSNIQRYEIRDKTLKLLENLPNDSMGKERTLEDFLCYSVENYPADKYAAIIWDHGSGSISGVAFDEQYDYDALTLDEMQAAFSAACDEMQGRFELIGMDACLMATLETAQALAPCGDYMVASQEILPAAGWDYTAIANSLTQQPAQGGDALGRTICDSFFQKCHGQGKDETATLSVTDLNDLSAVAGSFEAFSGRMEDDVRQDNLYYIVRCIEKSPAYGGATEHEGYSNLFDLGCFAENMEENDVCAALKKAVVYKRAGGQRADATGLSVYYPETLDQAELKRYMKICPFQRYAKFLDTAYSNIPQRTVEFLDTGSVADNGGFSIRLSRDSLRYVSTVEFELAECGEEDGLFKLGRDSNMYDDWDSGVFTCDFQGYWFALDRSALYSCPIDETDHSFIFSAPVLLNSQPANLRFAFEFGEDNKQTEDYLEGHYEILGIWSGIDGESGMSLAQLQPLQERDEITILYEDQSDTLEPGDMVTYQSGMAVQDMPLKAGKYRYQFIVTDIFGNTYVSDTALYEVKLSPEGKPAAHLIRIEKSGMN
jgi:hypothetical protein